MSRFALLCTLSLLLLAGCGAQAGAEIPEGLEWRAQTLAGQEDGALTAAWEDWPAAADLPLLDVTAQLEDGTIVLTDHAGGVSYTGSLTRTEDTDPNAAIYDLAFSGQPGGCAVYGVTEHQDGSRESALYLTEAGQTMYLTAPLPEG